MIINLDTQIREELAQASSIVIVAHVRPDGDAVGSVLGFGLALMHAGKRVQMVLEDGVDAKFLHLRGAELIQTSIEADYDYLIVVDCSDLERTGAVIPVGRVPDLVIDHHKTNLNFGRLNVVEPDCVATAALLAERLPRWGLEVDTDTAASLLAGILTDTIGFRTSNMTADALRISADLVDKGADLPRIYQETLVSRTLAETRYWAQGLQRVEVEDGILSTSLTLDDRIKAGYAGDDDAELVNFLSSVADTLVTVLFIEQAENRVKVSWRAVKGIDVSEIAFSYGGGGHAAAAGADLIGSLEAVKSDVLQKTRALLEA